MLSTKTRYTSHGEISVVESSGTGLPVVMIHGNSSCKEVFARQLESPLADKYRMIAFDLPGHGASQDAVDPARTYSMPGYADVMAIDDCDERRKIGYLHLPASDVPLHRLAVRRVATDV